MRRNAGGGWGRNPPLLRLGDCWRVLLLLYRACVAVVLTGCSMVARVVRTRSLSAVVYSFSEGGGSQGVFWNTMLSGTRAAAIAAGWIASVSTDPPAIAFALGVRSRWCDVAASSYSSTPSPSSSDGVGRHYSLPRKSESRELRRWCHLSCAFSPPLCCEQRNRQISM